MHATSVGVDDRAGLTELGGGAASRPRNYLAHRAGDAVDAVLAAARYTSISCLDGWSSLLSRFLAAQKAAAALQWV